MGEHAVRYTPDDGSHYVDVCPLCQDVALEHARRHELVDGDLVEDLRDRGGLVGELLDRLQTGLDPVGEVLAGREHLVDVLQLGILRLALLGLDREDVPAVLDLCRRRGLSIPDQSARLLRCVRWTSVRVTR